MIHFSHRADNMSWLKCERSEILLPSLSCDSKITLKCVNLGGKSEIKAYEGASLTD